MSLEENQAELDVIPFDQQQTTIEHNEEMETQKPAKLSLEINETSS